jgi:hypothetical protein
MILRRFRCGLKAAPFQSTIPSKHPFQAPFQRTIPSKHPFQAPFQSDIWNQSGSEIGSKGPKLERRDFSSFIAVRLRFLLVFLELATWVIFPSWIVGESPFPGRLGGCWIFHQLRNILQRLYIHSLMAWIADPREG